MKTTSKMKMTLKTKMTSKNNLPPYLREYYLNFFFMTSHLDSHRTTDIKPEMFLGVQTGNGTPYDKYDICGIAHVRTYRKDDIFMQRRLVENFIYIRKWRSFVQKVQPSNNSNIDKTFPAEAYSCLQVCVLFRKGPQKCQCLKSPMESRGD